MPFDHLVVAAGSSTNYFGIDGAREHAFPLYSLEDAIRVRNHLLSLFEAADSRARAGRRRGPQLRRRRRRPHRCRGRRRPGRARSTRCSSRTSTTSTCTGRGWSWSSGPTASWPRSRDELAALRPQDPGAARRRGPARHRGRAHRRRPRRAVERRGRCRTRLVLWAAGVRPAPLADRLGVRPGPRRSRSRVGADLSIAGHPEAFAIGDIADIDDGRGGRLPQLAQVAIQGGEHAAEQILADLDGRPRQPFRYRDKGTMATIGRRAAVAEIPRRGGARGPARRRRVAGLARVCTSSTWSASATGSRSSRTGRGTTSPGTAGPGSSCGPRCCPTAPGSSPTPGLRPFGPGAGGATSRPGPAPG